ncbi:GNAT family N-acetyltransferase [Coraliomargarita sp. SDUM461004]|uniref:GNAT family N-acetyltransferase n=1 Tax=Thalassobacterium sedimentorum TaxID=3041258 RepID=A0ABU1AHX9_9BACT|nr:GNAT family N-acetyltransferase [Coraliomargarita sp. SDUM461004]MDQ8193788.1 GNAT family N-acetyltransferase [Coraliomargarita sp. SDUM461004]
MRIRHFTWDSIVDDATWDRAVACYQNASLFHTSSWLKAIARIRGYRLYRLKFANKAGAHFLCPLLVRRRGAIRVASSSFEADGNQMGPLFSSCNPHIVQAALHEWCLDHDVQYMVLASMDPQLEQWPQLSGIYFLPQRRRPTRRTYRVDTTVSIDAILARSAKRFRATIRKAKRQGVQISSWTETRDFDQHLQLRSQFLRKKQSRPFLSNEDLEILVQALASDGRLRAYHALVDGELATSLIVARGPHGYYGVDSVSHSALLSTGAASAMYLHAFEAANLEGASYFDFTGGGSDSLVKFKESTGAQYTPLFRHDLFYSKPSSLARIAGLYLLSLKRRI